MILLLFFQRNIYYIKNWLAMHCMYVIYLLVYYTCMAYANDKPSLILFSMFFGGTYQFYSQNNHPRIAAILNDYKLCSRHFSNSIIFQIKRLSYQSRVFPNIWTFSATKRCLVLYDLQIRPWLHECFSAKL